MLLSVVKKILETYDKNKGNGRMVWDEPHIAKLRSFVDKLTGDDRLLEPMELLELALIVLDKRTINHSQSSKGFTKLANCFGGFDALSKLKNDGPNDRPNGGLLNCDRVAFLDKHPLCAKQFADTIVSLSTHSKLDDKTIDSLLKPLDNLENFDNLSKILLLIKKFSISNESNF